MNRRDFFRKLAAGAVPAAAVLAAYGCGPKAALVRDPAPPYFGPRLGGPTRYAAAPEIRPADPPASAVASASDEWAPPGSERPWQFIVLHHSATARGCAAEFDVMHRNHGWDELGYHFVIGNGTGSPDGLVEVGSRWPKQKHGAHCKVAGHPEYNDVGVGVCMVGNFDNTLPTRAQLTSCARVVQYLKDRYRVPRSRIYGHGQLKPTHCPGLQFPYDDVYRRLA
ncbi:MAG: N-acetylmuramoyl-L-alanine amidase [Acidobacteria bacterium]|nr:N-acetylmuramoyl-L-alanine amidase [Acidobacteriota bacterium]